MSKPYDAVTKRLIELRPADWVHFLRLPLGPVSLVDADLSTISVYADRLIQVDATIPYLVHNELESGKDTATVPLRLFHYNTLAVYKLRLPVVSTVFLLHKESNSPQITGRFEVTGPDGLPYVSFQYNVVRVWQLNVDELLTGDLGTLPLAPISAVRPADIPRVIQTMQARIDSEASNDAEAAELWTATNILMGLRYNNTFKAQMLRGVRRMRESITYKEILDEGRIEGLKEGRIEGLREGKVEGKIEGKIEGERRTLLLQGTRRFGEPSDEQRSRIESAATSEQLEVWLLTLLTANNWDEVLA